MALKDLIEKYKKTAISIITTLAAAGIALAAYYEEIVNALKPAAGG